MLKNISACISPELLYQLYCMGHGNEIVISDAHFPAYSVNKRVIRADGNEVSDLLRAIMPLFVLDGYVDDPVVMMAAGTGDTLPDGLVSLYQHYLPRGQNITFIDRFSFYDRAKNASCVVVTSTTKKYGNILLKKGVTPVEID